MAETRTGTARHAYERTVSAEIEDVWRALTDSDEVPMSWSVEVVESTWMPGEPVRFLDEDGQLLIEGTVGDVDPPHQLMYSFAFTADGSPEASGDAPSQVTWTLEPGDDGTRVTLVHDGFGSRNATWRLVEEGWDELLDGLVDRFDDEA